LAGPAYNGDPDNFLAHSPRLRLGEFGLRRQHREVSATKPFDDLVVKAKTVSDQGERTRLYEQAQVIFKEQAPLVHHRARGYS